MKPIDYFGNEIKVGDLVLDPAAGSYSVLKAAKACQRNFLGFDIG